MRAQGLDLQKPVWLWESSSVLQDADLLCFAARGSLQCLHGGSNAQCLQLQPEFFRLIFFAPVVGNEKRVLGAEWGGKACPDFSFYGCYFLQGPEGMAVLWWIFRWNPAVFCGWQWMGNLWAFDFKILYFAALVELWNTVEMLTN